MYKKILHTTKKRSCSIILIEIATANVQENITQHKNKTCFLVLFYYYFDPFFQQQPTLTAVTHESVLHLCT